MHCCRILSGDFPDRGHFKSIQKKRLGFLQYLGKLLLESVSQSQVGLTQKHFVLTTKLSLYINETACFIYNVISYVNIKILAAKHKNKQAKYSLLQDAKPQNNFMTGF